MIIVQYLRISVITEITEPWVASSSSFDGLGPFALFRINLKTLNFTESWYDSLSGGSVHQKEAIITGQHTHREYTNKKKRGFSPQANYTDRATAACLRS
jgi:hypothetical protein